MPSNTTLNPTAPRHVRTDLKGERTPVAASATTSRAADVQATTTNRAADVQRTAQPTGTPATSTFAQTPAPAAPPPAPAADPFLGAGVAMDTAERIDRRPVQSSGYGIDLAKFQAAITDRNEGAPPSQTITKFEDVLHTNVKMPDGTVLKAPTHMFPGKPVNVIPYANDPTTDAAGNAVKVGDEVLAKYFQPGEIGFMVKHHKYTAPDLSTDPSNKESMKLHDSHLGVVIGVEARQADGSMRPGVVTINNPQGYEGGEFGTSSYPMMFFRPTFPDYVSAEQVKDFENNMVAWGVVINTVSKFPGDFNGGDNLSIVDAADMKVVGEKCIRAFAGDADAKAWLEDRDNGKYIYCAELGFATGQGNLTPLTKEFWGPVVGEEVWNKFEAAIGEHNAVHRGEKTKSECAGPTKNNGNAHIFEIELKLPSPELKPLPEYAPAERREAEAAKPAFEPMTAADIVDNFLANVLPRREMGEQVAPAQVAFLTQMRESLMSQAGIPSTPGLPQRQAADAAYDKLLEVVGKTYGSYEEFRATLKPVLDEVEKMLIKPGGQGLFAPPHLFHVMAQGRQDGGLMAMDYVGHGVHASLCKPE